MEWKYDFKRFDYKNGGPCERGEFFSWSEEIGDWQAFEFPWRFGFGGTTGRGELWRGFAGSPYLCGTNKYRRQAERSSEDVFGESAEEVRNRVHAETDEHLQFGFESESGGVESFLTQKFRTADRLKELLVLKASLPIQVPTERMLLEFTPDEVDVLIAAAEVLKEHYTFTQNRREEGIIAAANFALSELGGVN